VVLIVQAGTCCCKGIPELQHGSKLPGVCCLCLLLLFVQAWYPAMCLDNLDSEKPNKFQLLGK